MKLFVTKVGNPIKLVGTPSYNGSTVFCLKKIQTTRNMNKANSHKFSSKTHTEDLAEPVSSLYERKSVPDELSDKIATFFIAHLFKYLFREWY
jgi:hypothetical protein